MSRILVLGGGVAGLAVTRALRFAPVEITLVDREPRHLTARDLYALALGRRAGVRRDALLNGQKNVRLVDRKSTRLNSSH